MRKPIATTIIVLVLAFTTVLLLSACTLFQSNESGGISATGQNAPVFREKIIAPRVNAESYYTMGCVFQERNKHHLAIEEFKMAVQSNPGHVAAYNGLGVSLDELGDYDRAVAAYKAALAIDQNLDYVLNNLGYSYLLQGRPELAVECFKRAVTLEGNNQRYRNNLGFAYAKSGKYDAAFAAFKAGGGEAEAHLNMARFYYRNGLYEEAGVHFSWASVINPTDADTAKSRIAAASLSQIYANTKTPPEKKEVIPAQKTGKQMARFDNDGFYTIPAGAIEDLKIVEADKTKLAENRYDASKDKIDQPIYTVTSAQIAKPIVDRAKTKNDFEEKHLQPFDVLNRMEQLHLETVDTGKVPITGSKIEISNGNGVRRMARTVGNYLETNGIKVSRLTNADHFNYPKTVIYYREGFHDQASRINGLLPGISNADHLVAAHLMREPIRVLIGRDLVPFNPHSTDSIDVDLSNGNGVNGMARRLGKHLNEEGFKVGRLTNADHFGYKKTIVFYSKGQANHAKRIADALPENCQSRLVELNNPNNRVQVLLGSDMVF